MGPVLLAARALLVVTFGVAGGAKLADVKGSRAVVAEFGVPQRLAPLVGVMLPVAELVVAVGLLLNASTPYAALGASLLLLGFTAAIATAMARGRAPDCHCFGQLHSEPAGWATLARNAVLLGVAVFVAVASWGSADERTTHWVGQVGTAWLAAGAAALVLGALVGFQLWFSTQLLAQHGRLLTRLDALESALGAAQGQPADRAVARPQGAAVNGNGAHGGLPLGVEAPPFALPGTDGETHSLPRLMESGKRLMLVFSDAGCGPCAALMPHIARWQRDDAVGRRIAVLVSGDRELNRAKAAEHGLPCVLLQEEREVAEAYRAYGTPMAVLIDADGRIASPVVGGSEAIERLWDEAAAEAAGAFRAPARLDGSPNGHTAPSASAFGSAPGLGEPAPSLPLLDLDGQGVALNELYGERTLAVFWNPGCSFCQAMLDDLRAVEHDAGPGSPGLLVISIGAPDAVRGSFSSRTLIDVDGKAMRAFGARGTPSAVLVEGGRIASPLAAGADAVLGLARRRAPEEPGRLQVGIHGPRPGDEDRAA